METTTLATTIVPAEEAAPDTQPSSAPAHGAAPAAELPTTYIRPAAGWQLLNVGELWQYRELLFFLTWRDVKVRYKQTVLGAAWAILQPVMMMVVFTIFFGRMAKVSSGDVPYPLFAFAGLLPWTFFSTAIANAGNSVVGSERLITKIYFPRLAVPLATVGAAVVDFAIALGVLILMMAYYRMRGVAVHFGPGLLLAPVVFAFITLAATGVGTLLAALNVSYRDFRYVIPFMVQLWLFATPTVYMQPALSASSKMKAVLLANPLAGLIAAFRSSMLGETIPWGHLAIAAAASVVLFVVGCLYFRKVEDSFADVI